MRKIIVAIGLAFVAGCAAGGGSAVRTVPAISGPVPILGSAPVADSGKFMFAIIGDRHDGDASGWPVFDRAVDEINLSRPDFVMTVGDLIQGVPVASTDTAKVDSMWRAFREHAGRLTAPLVLVPGNHDIGSPVGRAYWDRHVGRTYYSFDYRKCHFVVLNTEETADEETYLGEAQVAWAVADLAAHGDARHTFLFMHAPIGLYGRLGGATAEFDRIEGALGNRPYTVFGGHEHSLNRVERNGRRYFVLSTTGGFQANSDAPELGRFHHYTTVTIEGSAAHVAIRRPGEVFAEDVVVPGLARKLSGAISLSAEIPSGFDGARVSTAFSATVKNPFDADTLGAALGLEGLAADGWRLDDGGGDAVVPPGETRSIRAALSVPTERLVPPPRMRVTVSYRGARAVEWSDAMPVFPGSMTRLVPEWTVVGPYSAGPADLDLVDLARIARDPRGALPGVYRARGPESRWDAAATWRDGATVIRSRTVRAGDGRLDLGEEFGKDHDKLAFAICGVFAPTARTVYCAIEANDLADILVNGEPAMGNRMCMLNRGPDYVALRLEAGWNTLVVRSVNNGANWWFDFVLFDPAGDLRVAKAPEAG